MGIEGEREFLQDSLSEQGMLGLDKNCNGMHQGHRHSRQERDCVNSNSGSVISHILFSLGISCCW